MRFRYLIFLFLLQLSFLSIAQSDAYSIVEKTIIIDSLENRLVEGDAEEKAEIIFNLAFFYSKIDPAKAIDYSTNYIEILDKPMAISNNYKIYGLLSDLYFNNENFDKSIFYLKKQLSVADVKLHESVESVNNEYFNKEGDSATSSVGIKILQVIFLIVLLMMLGVAVFLWIKNSRIRKEISLKNAKLEKANTKYNEFNKRVNESVKKNTISQEEELVESKESIVDLRKSLKKVEESNYLKNAFLGNMSHQIRTPLSGILGFSDLLETELAVMGNEDLYEYAKSIQQSGTKLMSLIANVIDISSIEANILEIDVADIDINLLIHEVETGYLLKAREKGLVFKTKLDADIKSLRADKANMLKILNIIADNAVSYSSSGFVTISTKLNTDHSASVIVKDNGIGISEENLKKLHNSFDFSRKGTSLTYTGQGLGLILAHRLVNLMNGTLEIVSREGKGTDVTITLPCNDEYTGVFPTVENKIAKPSIINAPDLGVVKIFIVEDDRMNRMVIEKMLKKRGLVTLAVDGDDAISKLKKSVRSKNIYDVILMDINLPEPWDGVKLMNFIKEDIAEYKRVPFIAQTAYAFAGDEEQYLDEGFDDYVSKPLDKNVLLTKIQRLLEVVKDSE